MRQAYIMTLILVILGWIWLFPRSEPMTSVDQRAVVLEPFEIDIEGSVVFPGKYVFFKPVTASEVLEIAGGFLSDADERSFQGQTLLAHDASLFVSSTKMEDNHPTTLLDVNQASFKQLLEIPGMTEIRAASLIIYREQYGDFKSLDELILVKNIGEVTLEKIKPYLTV